MNSIPNARGRRMVKRHPNALNATLAYAITDHKLHEGTHRGCRPKGQHDDSYSVANRKKERARRGGTRRRALTTAWTTKGAYSRCL
jgi:hypothetical protein